MDENLSLTENDSSCVYNDTVDIFMYPTAYALFFIFGLLGNGLAFYVAWVLMKKGNSLVIYVLNLCISDLLYTITLPVWIMLAMRQTVNDTLCSLIGVIMYNSFFVGSGLLCCISVDRYLAVVFPFYFARAHKVRTAAFVSMLVWLIEISLHIGLLAYKNELQHFSSSRLCEERIPMDSKRTHVAIFRVILSFLIPLLLMAFCFYHIMVSLRNSTSTVSTDRDKIRNLLLLLLLVYIVSFTPFQVVMFLRGLLETDNCAIAKQLRTCYMVFVATTTLNSVLDPIIYCLITESAKTEILQLYIHYQAQLRRTFSVKRFTSSSINC